MEVMWRLQRLHRPAHGVPEAARHAAPVLGRVAVVDQRVPAVGAEPGDHMIKWSQLLKTVRQR